MSISLLQGQPALVCQHGLLCLRPLKLGCELMMVVFQPFLTCRAEDTGQQTDLFDKALYA